MKRIAKCTIVLLVILCISMGFLVACSSSPSKSASSSTSIAQSSKSSSSSNSALLQQSTSSASTVTSSFKEAMDEYESFIDGYCDFMNEYLGSGGDMSMLNDYSKWMNQYSTMMAKIQAIDSKSLSAADNAYYLEVVNRTNQKLASVF